MVIGYIGYTIMLAIWVWASDVVTNPKAYACMVLYLIVLGITVCTTWNKETHTKREIMLALVMVNLGLAVACRMGEEAYGNFMMDIFMMSASFCIVYLMIRYTRLTEISVLNWILMLLLPVMLLGARLWGDIVNGSYLTFKGIPVFAVLIGYPFVVAYAMAIPEIKFWGGNVKKMPKSLLGFLAYTVFLLFGSAICNEFGMLLILGVTATCVFYIKCKSRTSKLIYTTTCITGALLAANFVPHIHERIYMWLRLEDAVKDPVLLDKMGWNLYLFQNLKQIGWYGKSIGSMAASGVYGTLNSDHVFITLINDFSMLIAFAIIILACVWIWSILKCVDGARTYDYYLNLSIALIIGMLFLIHISSNLSSFITAGIPLPFISDAGGINVMLAILLATHCASDEKRRRDAYDLEEEETYP